MSVNRTLSLIAALTCSTSVLATDLTWKGLAQTPAAAVAPGTLSQDGATTARTETSPARQLAAPRPSKIARVEATKPLAPPDESALRYYASQNDTARVAAEIRRLKFMHSGWEPPQDLFDSEGSAVDEQPLWALFAEGRFEDLREAVLKIQEETPNWRPSGELVTKVEHAEARRDLIQASKDGDSARVLAIAEEKPGLLACAEMDVLWRVAEALVQTDSQGKAFELYRFVLTTCTNPQERLATVQKASVVLPPAMTERLIALGGRAAGSANPFESVRLDLLRKRAGDAIAEAGGELPAEDLRALETLAEQKRSAGDAILLGWLRYARKDWPGAATWFKKAMGWGQQPKAVEGYALALRQQNQLAEAERVSYEARKADPLIERLYIEIVATDLTKSPAPPIEAGRLAQFEQVANEAKSVTGSQALGWYYYNQGNVAQAETWFSRSVAWEPMEANVLGLALTSHRLKKTAVFGTLIKEHGARFPAVAALSRMEVAMAPRTSAKGRKSAGGGAGGGRLAQEAVELYKKGHYAQALATLDRRGGREDEGLSLLRGWSLYHLGDFQRAKDHFEAMDARRSTKDTQYGKFYANERMLPGQFRVN